MSVSKNHPVATYKLLASLLLACGQLNHFDSDSYTPLQLVNYLQLRNQFSWTQVGTNQYELATASVQVG